MMVDDLEMCRICTSFVNKASVTNLFEKHDCDLLTQIKNITGTLLKNEKNLPKYMCPACEENLKRAVSFRLRCLDSQSYFRSIAYRSSINLQKKSKNQNLKKDVKDVDSEEDEPEQDIVVVIKEEADSTDVKDNDRIHTDDKNNQSDDSSIKIERKDFGNNNNLQATTIEVKNIVKIRKQCTKTKRTKTKSFVQKRIAALKCKKPDEKNFICDQCGNHFNCRHHFLTHLRRHTNDKPIKCEICPDKFYTHSELKRHMRRHTGERPFSCQYCQRRFTDYSTRIKHERTHTNERPYSCKQCGKSFTTGYVLKNHMLVHTGERSFKCSLCNKAFQRQTHLTVHYRSIMHKQMLEKTQKEATQGSESKN